MKVLPCHTFLFVHVGHLQRYFWETFEISVFKKINDVKYSQYTVHIIHYYSIPSFLILEDEKSYEIKALQEKVSSLSVQLLNQTIPSMYS